jgi:hypothetical protein
MREFFRKFIEEVKLKKGWQKGMIYGAAIMIVIVFVLYGLGFQSGFGVFLDVLVITSVGVGGFFILVWIFDFIFYIFKRIPFILFAVLAAGVIILFVAQALPDDPYFYLSLGIIILGMLTGGIVGIFQKGIWQKSGKVKKGLLIFGALAVLSLNIPEFDPDLLDGGARHKFPSDRDRSDLDPESNICSKPIGNW